MTACLTLLLWETLYCKVQCRKKAPGVGRSIEPAFLSLAEREVAAQRRQAGSERKNAFFREMTGRMVETRSVSN